VFFPIYLNTHHGVRQIDPGLLEMARIYRLRGWELFRRVVLPGSLPSVLLGVRYALGIMWLTSIVAETISASSGIGYMTMNARGIVPHRSPDEGEALATCCGSFRRTVMAAI
jgi:sulfonate transport system permease protein